MLHSAEWRRGSSCANNIYIKIKIWAHNRRGREVGGSKPLSAMNSCSRQRVSLII